MSLYADLSRPEEVNDIVKDHREFLNEQPRVTASGSRHVHFALEPPEIMDV